MIPELSAGILEAFGLYVVRTSALFLASPLLGLGAEFSGYKVALIASVSIVCFLAAGSPELVDVTPGFYGLLALREILIGVFLAFTLHAAMLVVGVAGQMIGHEMGLNMSNMVDPVSGVSTPLVTRVYEVLFFLGLLSVDGHLWLVGSLSKSFDRAPIGSMELGEGVTAFVLTLFREMFTAGITFAAPVMILMALVSILVGLLARVVPHMNVLEVSFTLRIAVGLFAMFVFAPVLVEAMNRVYAFLMTALDVAIETV